MDGKEQEVENLKKSLSNAKTELEKSKAQLESAYEDLKDFKEEFDLKCANHEVALKNYKIVKPVWAFEEDPEYLENMRKLSLLGFKRFKEETQRKLEQRNKTIEDIKSQISSQESYIKGLEEELGEKNE